MDSQNFYAGQVVTAGDMDQIYGDAEAAENSLAQEASLSQAAAASAAKKGGILDGLVVTKTSATEVQVTLGAARDSNGDRIPLASTATVSLVNVGDTPAGDITAALGDGSALASLIAAGNEAWLSLFLVADEILSDPRTDALGNNLYYRIEESFHFNLAVGSDALLGSATSRAALADGKVLLADILCDENGEIRVISVAPLSNTDAICGSSRDLNNIGYGLDNTPALIGRRSDRLAIDADGTDFNAFRNAADTAFPGNRAYLSIRTDDLRDALRTLLLYLGSTGTAALWGGSDFIGTRQTTGGALTQNAAGALDYAANASLHTALLAIRTRMNNKASRYVDNVLGRLLQPNAGQHALQIIPGADAAAGLVDIHAGTDFGSLARHIFLDPYGMLYLPKLLIEDFIYISATASNTLSDHLPTHKWSKVGGASTLYSVQPGAAREHQSYFRMAGAGGQAGPSFADGIKGGSAFDIAANGAWMVAKVRVSALPADHSVQIGYFGEAANNDAYLEIRHVGGSIDLYVVKGDSTPQAIEVSTGLSAAQFYTLALHVKSDSEVIGYNVTDAESAAADNGDILAGSTVCYPQALTRYTGGGTSTALNYDIQAIRGGSYPSIL